MAPLFSFISRSRRRTTPPTNCAADEGAAGFKWSNPADLKFRLAQLMKRSRQVKRRAPGGRGNSAADEDMGEVIDIRPTSIDIAGPCTIRLSMLSEQIETGEPLSRSRTAMAALGSAPEVEIRAIELQDGGGDGAEVRGEWPEGGALGTSPFHRLCVPRHPQEKPKFRSYPIDLTFMAGLFRTLPRDRIECAPCRHDLSRACPWRDPTLTCPSWRFSKKKGTQTGLTGTNYYLCFASLNTRPIVLDRFRLCPLGRLLRRARVPVSGVGACTTWRSGTPSTHPDGDLARATGEGAALF
ncbi:hypothetical protein K488DRAFT_74752 [Vararia minispora EC-137]|uniref:Uncharacterized protein n=1 Tax=Vararia minispora EC-137 TaxID=1314806 RepID=A0ACB8Q6Q2_9AGAM|nr:hypothetical protein K488DRAFT_74752 [Vararia minispora EC-137]